MESDQPSTKPNKLLNQYVYHMESEIGRSGKTVHQVLSEFLKLKTEYPNLATQAENLEIPSAETLSVEHVEHYANTLRQHEALRNKVLQSVGSLTDHPWYGIAHPNHKPDAFDSLVRTMRFVNIQLNKLWVEIQSVPLFLNAVDRSPLSEIERIFRWLLSSPKWNDLISQPRVIPALAQLETRKTLLDFARDVRSVQLLRDKIQSKEDPKFLDPSLIRAGLDLITEAIPLVARYQVGTLTPESLRLKAQGMETKVNRLEAVQRFFSKLSIQNQFPCAKNINDARKVYFASQLIKSIPNKILPFRTEKILNSEQFSRIDSWKEQARSLLETRRRIDLHFRVRERVTVDELLKLATDLTSAGALRTFNSTYQAAVRRYEQLLRVEDPNSTKKRKKETPAEMALHLKEWANYLEQVKAFESQPELRNVFDSNFKGIETEFGLAAQANHWAAQLKTDLKIESDSFGKALNQYLLVASELSLNTVLSSLTDEVAREIGMYLNDLDLGGDLDFSEVSNRLKLELADLKRLQGLLANLDFRSDAQLSALEELKIMTEEVIFLTARMDSNSDLKQWLRSSYRGADTDLAVIDQSLVFVQFIESADIPNSLKTTFISAYGPQRLNESRAMVASTWSTLEASKESIQKLELATHGQTRSLSVNPIPVLLNRLQQALKQPSMLHDWVEYIQNEHEAKTLGLGKLIEQYDNRNFKGWELDQVFECAFLASLLKKAIVEPAAGSKGVQGNPQSPSAIH